jgi:hypothetical protein
VSVASPPTKTRHRSCRGAATYPARWWTGATCRGRPRRRLPAPPKCRHRVGRRRPRVTKMWARARDKQLALPERTNGRSMGRAPLSRRKLRPAKLTRQGGRRSGQLPPASSSTVPTTPTWTPCRGIGLGRSRRTRRQCRARRRRQILAPPRGACSCYLSVVAEPRTFMSPSSPVRAKDQPWPSQRSEDQPPSGRGSVLPPLRRRIEAEQPSSWRAPNVQPPSRACRNAQRRSLGCAPRCKSSSPELTLWIPLLALLANLDLVFS